MQWDHSSLAVSRGALWTGRIRSALPVLFLLLDGVLKLALPPPGVESKRLPEK